MRRLLCLPQDVNDHLMKLRLPIWGNKFTTIVSIDAAPITSSYEAKNKFPEELNALLANLHPDNSVLLPSDVAEGDLDTPPVKILEPAGICPSREVKSAGRAADKVDPRYRWMNGSSPRPLKDEAFPTAAQDTQSDHIQIHIPYTSTNTTITNTAVTTYTSSGDSVLTRPHCDNTYTSHISLIGQLRINRTKTGKPVPCAPTHGRDRHFYCPKSPRAFTHGMCLFGYMRIDDSRIFCNVDSTDSKRTFSAPAILTTTATTTTMDNNPQAHSNFY
ncbi:unnamed protein product [Schistocephalus solidus]|uniref:Uncharacterized protein n=1 Tax=Schistocephalus solidus TaxID=70667 RepID=A0A183SYV1_SCHSO|nr:unnamed protein product [Schistocephalus solidus]